MLLCLHELKTENMLWNFI